MGGIDDILAARSHLAAAENPWSALLAASERFLAASVYEGTWPPPLKAAAASVRRRLMADGPIRLTVSAMPAERLTGAAAELRAFCTSALATAGLPRGTAELN